MLIAVILLLSLVIALLVDWLFPVSFILAFLGVVILAFAFLWFVCAIIDPNKPQKHDSRFYRTVVTLYIDALVRVLRVRFHTTGLEKIPTEGRFLLVCNHTSNADPVILLHCFAGSQLAFISKQENSSMFLVGKVMPKLMCQLVNRENDREALKTIVKCIQLIRDDEVSVAVFPEGYIHADRKLHHFRYGVFKIATKTNVPIVVCTLRNSQQVIDNIPKLKPTDVHLHLLDVITPEQYAGMTTVELGEKVYQMMADDLGPELVSEE